MVFKSDMVFGLQSVSETLRAGQEIEKVYLQKELVKISPKIQEILAELRERNLPYSLVPQAKLDHLTRKNHQGVVAFISPIRFVSLANVVADVFERGENPFVLVLDRITDVRNFGAIVRTAECAGVHAIVVPVKGSAQIGADAMKTSSGALNYLPVCREVSVYAAVKYLQDSGLQIVASTEKADKTIYDTDLSIPTAVVMGSEEDGISPEVLRRADAQVRIPLLGQLSSLNVSVAAGISLFEVVRQRTLAK